MLLFFNYFASILSCDLSSTSQMLAVFQLTIQKVATFLSVEGLLALDPSLTHISQVLTIKQSPLGRLAAYL